MDISNDFIEELIGMYYRDGYKKIEFYVKELDPIFLEEFLDKYVEAYIQVNLLDVAIEGLARPLHKEMLRISEKFKERICIRYLSNEKKDLRRIITFDRLENLFYYETSKKVFLGPFEFSREYFCNESNYFICLEDQSIIKDLVQINATLCTDENIDVLFNLYDLEKVVCCSNEELQMDSIIVGNNKTYSDFVHLKLVNNKGEVPAKSGLNWGQRKNRNKNQMYISVPLAIHNSKPDFFPLQTQGFLITTNDGINLVCTMAQQNRKAIQTKGDTSILGAYFRKKIGVLNYGFVVKDHLDNYGRDYITLFKIKEGLYYLDF